MKKIEICSLITYLLLILTANRLMGQEMLANPSFEITGTGNTLFNGWNEFGSVGVANESTHGQLAAEVSGQDNGSVNVSAFWQQLDCDEGEQWEISGNVMNTSDSPLTGDCIALVNIEWRDSNDELIDYESFTVADVTATTDVYTDFDLLSSPAPGGTTTTHLLIGVLQTQSDPSPKVYYDQITFYSTTPPTVYDMQWDDFPSGRTIDFSERTWRVKGTGWYGPGPNHFNHTSECVWVDDEDYLHLTIKNIDSIWYSTEVTLVDTLGYGDYIFTTLGSLDQLDINSVLGLFLWQYGPGWDPGCSWWNPHNEIDVEYSRWGSTVNDVGQFVVQPWDWENNMSRYDVMIAPDALTSHAFRWLPHMVEFRSWFGSHEDESPENIIHEWIYTGPHIPRPELPRVHINLWQCGSPLSAEQEVMIQNFAFIPQGDLHQNNDLLTNFSPFLLHQNIPNPFNITTSISYTLYEVSDTRIDIYNIRGQRVRTLINNIQAPGDYMVNWNGTDNNNRSVPSGLYLYRLDTGITFEARKCILLK